MAPPVAIWGILLQNGFIEEDRDSGGLSLKASTHSIREELKRASNALMAVIFGTDGRTPIVLEESEEESEVESEEEY